MAKVTLEKVSKFYGNVEAVINIDGMTDGSSATIAATDKLAFSDGGTEKYLVASQLDTYVSGTTKTLTNKTLTAPQLTSPVLNTGVSSSGFGNTVTTKGSALR